MVLGLPATPESVTTARRWLTRVLAGWAVERSMLGDAELVFSELVTNAIRHGGGDIECGVAMVGGNRCRVSVTDTGAERPFIRQPQLDDPGGRGLPIIDRLADSWGVTDSPDGKTVWAIVAS